MRYRKSTLGSFSMSNSKEIGGYLEMERYSGSLYHDDALALSSGRGCLEYLIEARSITEIWLPDYLCSSVESLCNALNIVVKRYEVGFDMQPDWNTVSDDAGFLYLVDYFGVLSKLTIERALERFDGCVIVDETENFFRKPHPHVDTLYSIRKYFGVPDGAFLYTDKKIARELPRDESRERMRHILGRFEKTASDFYGDAQNNNAFFADRSVRKMSDITENILRSLDYEAIAKCRETNYRYLEERLAPTNSLHVDMPSGPFAYPYLTDNGLELKRRLAAHRIYVPTLWPNVLADASVGSAAHELAADILPLPVDQRYDTDDMQTMLDVMIEEGVKLEHCG